MGGEFPPLSAWRRVSAAYWQVLDLASGVWMWVEFSTVGPDVVDYTLVLLVEIGREAETVRVYDSAHRFNELHRYTRSGGKQAGVAFHSGSLGEGMRAAVAEMKYGYTQIIEGWER
jgi:hypothetical protein